MGQPVIQRSFSAGEVSPSYGARADLALYSRGLKRCRNFLVQESGGAANRPGTRFLAAVKVASLRTYLMPVVFSDELAYVVEMGDAYFRFYRNGQRVETAPGVAYELVTPYVTADLPNLQFEQTGDTVTITHRNYHPRELRIVTETNWTLLSITTQPGIAAPTGIGGGFGATGPLTISYLVTAVANETYEESLASNPSTLIGVADPTPSNPIATTWSLVAGAAEYKVYKDPYQHGTYGFIGRTALGYFNDVGLLPDFEHTPPKWRQLFGVVGDYPMAVGYYQQRRLFANTSNNPEMVWASKIGFHGNFSVRSPQRDDDAVTWQLSSRKAQDVRYLLDLKRLLVMTTTGEWKINGDGEGGTLIPTAINPDRQGYAGTALVRPQVIGESVFYVQARGNRIRRISLDQEIAGVGSTDVSAFARHLFKGKTITRMALQVAPQPVLWCLRSDGVLLALTYIEEQEIVAWSWHDTGENDAFEDVVTVPEGDEDGVYVTVRRTVNGADVRYVERFASRQIDDVEADAWFLDSALAYDGAATATFTGLTHLAGRDVRAFADGEAVPGTLTVNLSGTVTLPATASVVRVGLPITAQLETLDFDTQGSDARDKRKTINSVSIIIEDSARGFYVGPTVTKLSQTKPETWDTNTQITGSVEARITSSWSQTGRVVLQHTDPSPLTVLAIVPNVTIGG